MKTYLQKGAGYLLIMLASFFAHTEVLAQATVSIPFAVGTQSCIGTTASVNYYTYNETTNALANASNPAVCTPWLRIGTSGNTSTANSFKSGGASISYNPQDKNIYYFWTTYSPSVQTYVWRWPVGTCAGSNTSYSARLAPLRSFAYDILGVAFDKSGNGYILEFGTTIPNTAYMRSIDFATGVIGVQKQLSFTGGAVIYQDNVTGDVAISPSGQMYFVADNKLFTPDYASYSGASTTINCTYIDTIKTPGAGGLVGLTYAQGELIASYTNGTGSGKTCTYNELNPLTGGVSSISGSSLRSVSDFASVISGIGVSKKLVSVPVYSATNQYDVEYDVYVQNYGNYPLTSVQVTDDLRNINGGGTTGAANVNIISKTLISGPAGLTINNAYDGETNFNLLAAGQTLSNLPGQNSFTIRIKCRLSNILQGKVYNNSATATAVGFNNAAVTDISTNGTSPDLNSNDKPDDAGENQPTPLLIAVAAQTPPCGTLGQVFYSETFGTGATEASLPASPGGTTTYTGSNTQPLAIDRYMLATNANMGDNTKFISLADHTDGTGRMMIVNADATDKVFYAGILGALCANQQYSLSFYAAFIGNPAYKTICDGFGGFKYPKVKMRVKDGTTGLVIAEISTADITATSWNQYGMKWVMPAGYSNITFELINDGQGGCGNDIALDDIQFGTCDAAPMVSVSAVSAGCIGTGATLSTTLSDASVIPGTKEYQWQVSNDNVTYTNISSATTSTFSIASVSAGDVNKYYRILVAATGNMSSENCRYASPGFLLTAKTSSTAPTVITKSKTIFCPGESVTLQASGATLGANAVYRWYLGSCGGTLIGTGATITVSPTVATTYFVRVEGDCNTTACISTAITFNCDLDADKDGITDVAESGGIDPKLDDDLDGIPNWRDAQYPGFLDGNGDGVNDAFDNDLDGIPNFLDRDSDNDGIPDVVESGGADANGDGRLDGFTDSDNDGLSDNVDANLGGHLSSGSGLGLLDTDGDGVPNYIDLDSDNDGIPDVVEVYGTDSNNDGRLDFAGTFAANDSDGDGLLNAVDGDANNDGTIENTTGALLKTGAVLSNGRTSGYPTKNMDADSKPNPYDLDSDGDGIADVREAQFADDDFNGKIDGTFNANGWSTTVSAMSALILPNTDGTGRANPYDIDSDDDGIPDNVEGIATNSYKLPAGTDSDGDGLDNAYDNLVGFGGSGIFPSNQDGDAYPDYIDTDTDGDGMPDINEGNDFNRNGKADDDVALTGLDTDDDGLDDKFDADNSSAKATSAYMGNAGSPTGPAAPGSTTTVQKTISGQADRDWRQMDYVLNLNFVKLSAAFVNNSLHVSWRVVCSNPVQTYKVERSTNGVNFIEIASVSGSGALNTFVDYSVVDKEAKKGSTRYYYRIKAIAANGKFKQSPVVDAGYNSETENSLQLEQNPVSTYLKCRVVANTDGDGLVYIYNQKGQLVASSIERLTKGYNSLIYPVTANLPGGLYVIKVLVNGQVHVAKFIIKK